MTNIQRICEQCGESGPLNVRYCPHCGFDTHTGFDTHAGLPTAPSNLPMVIGKAALPILVGAASLALRAGWKLLQNRVLTDAVLSSPTAPSQSPQNRPTPPPPASTRSNRKIHIRSSWTVGDAHGNWSQGSSEHTIEFED